MHQDWYADVDGGGSVAAYPVPYVDAPMAVADAMLSIPNGVGIKHFLNNAGTSIFPKRHESLFISQ